MHSVRLISVVMAALTLAATTLATPAAAAQAPADYGSTYACRYQPMRGTMYAALKRIAVAPPIVYGDEANQTVGWRVIIRRDRFVNNSDLGKTTYWRSAIHKALASPDQAADFSKVVYMVPPLGGKWDYDLFTGSIKLIWYNPDGTVSRSITHEFESSYTYVHGKLWWHLFDPTCERPRQIAFVD
jgi:hypothetical protein